MLKDEINKNILKTISAEILDLSSDELGIYADMIPKDSISTVEKKTNLDFVDENNERKELLKKEIIKIYPIDDYNIYETLVTLTTTHNNREEILDSFYFLIMVTSDNRMLNCKFIDLSVFSEKSQDECDNYQNIILDEAKNYSFTAEDTKALQKFIELIRKKSSIRIFDKNI